MKKKKTEILIGDWWAPCCLHDLQQVKDYHDLETIDDLPIFRGGWTTCSEAVSELIQGCDKGERKLLFDWYRGDGHNELIALEIEKYL